jgi:hypothetical protein
MNRREFLKTAGLGAIVAAIAPKALVPRPEKYRLSYWRKPAGGDWEYIEEIIESYGLPDIVIKPPYLGCKNWMLTEPCLVLKCNPRIRWIGNGETRKAKKK